MSHPFKQALHPGDPQASKKQLATFQAPKLDVLISEESDQGSAGPDVQFNLNLNEAEDRNKDIEKLADPSATQKSQKEDSSQ